MENFKRKSTVICLIAVLILAGCILLFLYERKQKEDFLNEASTVFDTFFYQDTEYTLSTVTENYTDQRSILRSSNGDAGYLILPGEKGQWCQEIQRIVYAKGKKICTCDINGADRETIFQVSGWRVYAMLRGVIGKYAVVCSFYEDARNHASLGSGVYCLIDLTSGSILETEIPASSGISLIAVDDKWFYFGTGDLEGKYADIRRCSLETGEYEILTSDIPGYVGYPGCTADEYLYFHYEYGGVYRIPVSGGAVERLNYDFSEIGARGVARMVGYNGSCLIACLCDDGDIAVMLRVYSFDWESQTLREEIFFDVDKSYHLTSLRVQDDTLIASSINSASLYKSLPPHIMVSAVQVGGDAFEFPAENAEIIMQILSADSWIPDATNCDSDYLMTFGDRTIYYHSECGTFNERLEQSVQSLHISEKEKETINSIFEVSSDYISYQ